MSRGEYTIIIKRDGRMLVRVDDNGGKSCIELTKHLEEAPGVTLKDRVMTVEDGDGDNVHDLV